MQEDRAFHRQIDPRAFIPRVRSDLILIVAVRVDELVRLLLHQVHRVEELDARAGHRRYPYTPQQFNLG